MDQGTSLRTAAYVAGITVLLIVLLLVAGISTGILPWRDSYADSFRPTPDGNNAVIAVTPTPTAKPTPTPDGNTEDDPAPTPTPTPTPQPTPTPGPGITLDEELPTYIITVTFSRGGTAIPYGINAVVQNGSMSVVAVPDEGYEVDEMIVDGIKYKGLDTYQFTNVNEDHTVYISFSRSFFIPEKEPEA